MVGIYCAWEHWIVCWVWRKNAKIPPACFAAAVLTACTDNEMWKVFVFNKIARTHTMVSYWNFFSQTIFSTSRHLSKGALRCELRGVGLCVCGWEEVITAILTYTVAFSSKPFINTFFSYRTTCLSICILSELSFGPRHHIFFNMTGWATW